MYKKKLKLYIFCFHISILLGMLLFETLSIGVVECMLSAHKGTVRQTFHFSIQIFLVLQKSLFVPQTQEQNKMSQFTKWKRKK